jgi:hypothetical protein
MQSHSRGHCVVDTIYNTVVFVLLEYNTSIFLARAGIFGGQNHAAPCLPVFCVSSLAVVLPWNLDLMAAGQQ